MRNDGLEFVAGALRGGGAGGVSYYHVCRRHFEENKTKLIKMFAGRMMVNIVKENEAKINCEVCRNGSIRKV